MTLDDRLIQLVRDALEPMLAERLTHLEERLLEGLAGVVQPPPSDAPRLLTKKEVAAYLRVDRRTLARMITSGRFPPPILISPGCPRWRQETIDAWVDRRGS